MPVDSHTLEIANDYELRPLPVFTSKLPEYTVIELVQNAVRLRRISRYIVLLAASTGTVRIDGRGREVRSISKGAEEMIVGGSVFGHQSDGIIMALDVVAPREDTDSWTPYIEQHLEMPELLRNKLD